MNSYGLMDALDTFMAGHLRMRTATLKHSIPLVFRLRKVFDSRNILPQYFPITYTITAECTFKLPPNIKGCPHLQYENVVQFFFHSLTMVSFLFD